MKFLAISVVILTFSINVFSEDVGHLYSGKCAICHGENGKGDTEKGRKLKTPDLGSADVQNKSDADLSKVIEDGKGKMPKFGNKLTKAEIHDVVMYIRKFKPPAPAPQMFSRLDSATRAVGSRSRLSIDSAWR